MKFRSLLCLAAASLSFASLPKAAIADTLTIANQTAPTTGGVLAVSGTFSNTSGTLEYLNADSYTIAIPGNSVDDSPYLLNGVETLPSGESFTEELFTLSLPSGLAPGSYGAFFSILGGTDPGALNTLATAGFTVNVGSATSVTPEPATWLLLGTGVLGLGITLRRRNGSFAAPIA